MTCLLWLSLWFFLPLMALAQSWQLAGQTIITFAGGQEGRIAEINERLGQIIRSSDPLASWSISQRPVYVTLTEKSKDPKVKPKTVQKLQTIEIFLNNNFLLAVREEDVSSQGAASLEALANEWTNTLTQFFRTAENRRSVYLSQVLPPTLTYQGKIYKLVPEPVLDRGLFRTTGVRVADRVVFWEVPANDRTYLLDSQTKQQIEKSAQNPDRIFIFDPKLQFIGYTRVE
ncbi:MAG: hypothetical protein RMK91_06035 [Pseudanabaenaceae cyanobacterium SKYGB_i_bin29]|nr:hypothetical protein [Pseudanabaenaceae cyanobacterium SKYG29]MDW8421411.1 hypothetical protein [Pseudanabaenaceae cyanobacterium SKYGB_i_bin29]